MRGQVCYKTVWRKAQGETPVSRGWGGSVFKDKKRFTRLNRQRACWVEEPRLGSAWCLPGEVAGGRRKWQENEVGAAGAMVGFGAGDGRAPIGGLWIGRKT